MKKYLPYAIAALVGFHLRWTAAHLAGADYSMNGADIIVAIACIIMVWSVKGAFLGERRTSNVHVRAKRHSGRAVPQRKQPEDMR